MSTALSTDTDIAIVTPFEAPHIVAVVTGSDTYPDLRREVVAALDQVRALPSYEALDQEMTVALVDAKALTVRDQASYDDAGTTSTTLASLEDRAKAWWEPSTALAFKLHRWLTARRGLDTTPLKTERDRLLTEAGAWFDEQERQRVLREAEIAAEEKRRNDALATAQAAALEAQGEHELAAAVINEAVAAPAPIVSLPSVASAGLSHGKDYEIKVLNADIVPRHYLMVDEARVLKMVRAMDGKIKIPGIQITAKTATRGRRRSA